MKYIKRVMTLTNQDSAGSCSWCFFLAYIGVSAEVVWRFWDPSWCAAISKTMVLMNEMTWGSEMFSCFRFLFPAGWGGKMLNQKRLIKTQNRPFQHPQWKSQLWMLSRQVAKGPLSCAMTWNNLACFYRWGNFGGEFEGDFFWCVFCRTNLMTTLMAFQRIRTLIWGVKSVVLYTTQKLIRFTWLWTPYP